MAEHARGPRSKRKPASDCSVRQARQDFTKFKALIATPGNLVSGVSLPGGADLYISSTSVLAATTLLVDAAGPNGTRAMGSPARAADDPYHIGYMFDATLTKHAGAPGTVKLYVRRHLGHLFLIAQG